MIASYLTVSATIITNRKKPLSVHGSQGHKLKKKMYHYKSISG